VSISGLSTAGTSSAIAEVYPALWSRGFADEGRTADQHDAFSIAAWLARADRDGMLTAFLKPDLLPRERALAEVEGWILGVSGFEHTGNHRSVIVRARDKRTSERKTTQLGYKNANNQTVLRATNELGNDHNQRVYVLHCGVCGHEYGANGSDIWQRRCPSCQGGIRGLAY
jgi:hypothetical protein